MDEVVCRDIVCTWNTNFENEPPRRDPQPGFRQMNDKTNSGKMGDSDEKFSDK